MGEDCPHLSLVLKVSKEDLLIRSQKPCQVCRKRGTLWACLQESCQFVGCAKKLHDHSKKHYLKYKHAIAVNLNSFRIWCFSCEKEVHMPSAFTSVEMKSLKKSQKMHRDRDESKSTNDKQETPRESQPVSSEAFHSDINSPPLGLTGLQNMGNTCYMNSALQAISNCPPVTHFFVHSESDTFFDKKPSMARCYFHLMRDMWSPNQRRCIAPSGIHTTLKTINPSFRGYQQQDAQEFLRCFMDRLHEELKCIIPKWTYTDEVQENIHEEPSNTEEEPMEVDDEGGIDVPMPSARVPDMEPESVDSFRIVSESQPPGKRSSKVFTSPGRSRSPQQHVMQLHGVESPGKENMQQSRNRTSNKKLKYQNQQDRPSRKPDYRFRSIVSEIFDGELRSSVQCLTCDQVSHTRETFQDLSLPIPGKDDLTRLHSTSGLTPVAASAGSLAVIPGFKGPCSENTPSWSGGIYDYVWDAWEWLKSWFWGPQVTLNDCLSAFFSADELKGDNMYSCNKCNKLRNGMKYCKLLQLPEVLCIHLKRFRHEYLMSYSSKISSPVTFPIKGLDLRQYLAQDSPSTCTTYDLCSIIVHHGNAGGGHYTAYARNMLDNEWYEFDDQIITKVPESFVASAEAYVLFYQKSSAESSRAKQRILQTLSNDKNRQGSSQDLLQFYISVAWLNKFYTFAEPGPIDNSDFLCRHSGVLPSAADSLEFLIQPVSEPLWQMLHQRYGGGPVVTALSRCPICEEEYFNIQCRRDEEKETFMKLTADAGPTSAAQMYISLEWFKEWEDFLNDKLPDPPGKVDNWPICYTKEGKQVLRKSSPYAPIPQKAWDYLISVYGGGPEVTPYVRATSKSPNRQMKTPRTPSPSTPMQDRNPSENVKSNTPQEDIRTSSTQEQIQIVSKDDGSCSASTGVAMDQDENLEQEEDTHASSEESIIASPSHRQLGETQQPNSLEDKES